MHCEGPSTKKFRILAQFKENELRNQYSKHFRDSTNKLQLLRLKANFDKVHKRKMVDIEKCLKPVGYRDSNQPLPHINDYDYGLKKSDKMISH